MTQYPAPICLLCRRFTGLRDEPNGDGTPTCEAFPRGIPTAIWHSVADHRASYRGDGGLHFLPKEPGFGAYADTLFGAREPEGEGESG